MGTVVFDVGYAIPLETFDGDTAALTDYVGTPLLLNFWASWCPPCIAEMPDLEAVHQLTDGQVTFVGVNTQDTPDRAEALTGETGSPTTSSATPTARCSRRSVASGCLDLLRGPRRQHRLCGTPGCSPGRRCSTTSASTSASTSDRRHDRRPVRAGVHRGSRRDGEPMRVRDAAGLPELLASQRVHATYR